MMDQGHTALPGLTQADMSLPAPLRRYRLQMICAGTSTLAAMACRMTSRFLKFIYNFMFIKVFLDSSVNEGIVALRRSRGYRAAWRAGGHHFLPRLVTARPGPRLADSGPTSRHLSPVREISTWILHKS